MLFILSVYLFLIDSINTSNNNTILTGVSGYQIQFEMYVLQTNIQNGCDECNESQYVYKEQNSNGSFIATLTLTIEISSLKIHRLLK